MKKNILAVAILAVAFVVSFGVFHQAVKADNGSCPVYGGTLICPTGQTCVYSTVTDASTGELVMVAGCYDLMNDPNNCGSWNHKCPADQNYCLEGWCVTWGCYINPMDPLCQEGSVF